MSIKASSILEQEACEQVSKWPETKQPTKQAISSARQATAGQAKSFRVGSSVEQEACAKWASKRPEIKLPSKWAISIVEASGIKASKRDQSKHRSNKAPPHPTIWLHRRAAWQQIWLAWVKRTGRQATWQHSIWLNFLLDKQLSILQSNSAICWSDLALAWISRQGKAALGWTRSKQSDSAFGWTSRQGDSALGWIRERSDRRAKQLGDTAFGWMSLQTSDDSAFGRATQQFAGATQHFGWTSGQRDRRSKRLGDTAFGWTFFQTSKLSSGFCSKRWSRPSGRAEQQEASSRGPSGKWAEEPAAKEQAKEQAEEQVEGRMQSKMEEQSKEQIVE
jgi:hypothetical protein